MNAPYELFCTTDTGNPISHRTIFRHFHEALAELGIPTVKFYSLRHSFAFIQLINRVNAKTIQEALGHSIISLTLAIYSHIIPALQKEAVQKKDAIFKQV